jgi:hypothetical protein
MEKYPNPAHMHAYAYSPIVIYRITLTRARARTHTHTHTYTHKQANGSNPGEKALVGNGGALDLGEAQLAQVHQVLAEWL